MQEVEAKLDAVLKGCLDHKVNVISRLRIPAHTEQLVQRIAVESGCTLPGVDTNRTSEQVASKIEEFSNQVSAHTFFDSAKMSN